jgi:hypothetical protein
LDDVYEQLSHTIGKSTNEELETTIDTLQTRELNLMQELEGDLSEEKKTIWNNLFASRNKDCGGGTDGNGEGDDTSDGESAEDLKLDS